MAVTADSAILAILKTFYKDGVENLLFRNSPVVKEIKKSRVEGKEQRFAAIYSRGGAVAGSFLVAQNKAASNVKNAEFVVTPGQLFSVFSYNAKEVQASLSRKGAYMKVAGNKAFAATEALRKSLAAAFYGRGYGEIAVLGTATEFTASTAADITLPEDAIMKIDVGSDLALKTSIAATAESCILTVNSINGTTVNVTPATTYSAAATDVVCLRGSMDASGNPILPMGIDGWLPVVSGRSGATWTTYIGTSFNGVTRSVNAEGLAGSFVVGTSTEGKKDTVQRLMQKVRRRGSQANMIILNDSDWLALADEIQSTNTYFTQTSTKAERMANVGLSEISASFSTNFIDNIYDDPYCPEGKFYVLDKDDIEFWTYTNAEAVNDGVANNNPGKQNPEELDNAGKENDPYKLLIDDFITTQPGTATIDGPAVEVTLQVFGSFVVLNPSNAGVGLFYNANGYSGVIGY